MLHNEMKFLNQFGDGDSEALVQDRWHHTNFLTSKVFWVFFRLFSPPVLLLAVLCFFVLFAPAHSLLWESVVGDSVQQRLGNS